MIVVVVLLLGIIFSLILYPLYRPSPAALDGSGGALGELGELEQRKLLLYAAIREVGFDYRTDKLTTEDYETEVEHLKRQAMQVVSRIQRMGKQTPRGSSSLERRIDRTRRQLNAAKVTSQGKQNFTPYCTECGRQTRPTDSFCAGCGSNLVKME